MTVLLWPFSFNRLFLTPSEYPLRLKDLAGQNRPMLTEHLRQVQHSWANDSVANEIFLYLLATAAVFFGLWLLSRWLKLCKKQVVQIVNDPDRLFENLLNTLELTETDKKLIREMAAGARLRHPSICLLSPALLEWTGHLWQNEKGPKTADAEKLTRLDEISIALYDHVTPAAARQISNQTPKSVPASLTGA